MYVPLGMVESLMALFLDSKNLSLVMLNGSSSLELCQSGSASLFCGSCSGGACIWLGLVYFLAAAAASGPLEAYFWPCRYFSSCWVYVFMFEPRLCSNWSASLVYCSIILCMIFRSVDRLLNSTCLSSSWLVDKNF